MRLYERAAAEDKSRSLLHAEKDLTFWAGSAGYLRPHRGAAPVLLAGLYGKFSLRLEGTPWQLCRAAIIPPGLCHELDFHGKPFGALYIEPNLGGLNAIAPLLSLATPAGGASLGDCEAIPMLRSLYEDRSGKQWAGDALSDLLAFARHKASSTAIDPRIAAAVGLLQASCGDVSGVDWLAQNAGLSKSRFQHLFTQQAGVPFRRYRAWQRLRIAWQQIAKGASITQAAHASGFFDSAHFAHEYRETFGKACAGGPTPGAKRPNFC